MRTGDEAQGGGGGGGASRTCPVDAERKVARQTEPISPMTRWRKFATGWAPNALAVVKMGSRCTAVNLNLRRNVDVANANQFIPNVNLNMPQPSQIRIDTPQEDPERDII